jgi:aspartate kinase
MSTDPRIAPEARILDTVSFREISELAFYGARVLHPKTIRPVLEAGIPLRVKNTFNPAHPGTLVVEDNIPTANAIKAVTLIRDQSLITVEGKGLMGVIGIAARTFGAVAKTGTSILLISQASSEQSICFVVPQTSRRRVVEALEHEFALEITRRDVDHMTVQDDVAVVTIVGAGMVHRPGTAGRIFTATGEAGVNVIAIAQGSSEVSISMVVTGGDGDKAIRAIHPLTLEG